MREIKFRAWNTTKKDWTDFRYSIDSGAFEEAGVIISARDVIVMQSTGLRDRTGREIYEGDILQTTYPNSPGAKPVYKVVEWVNGHSYTGFNITDKRSGHIPREIVGNIYENADLLT